MKAGAEANILYTTYSNKLIHINIMIILVAHQISDTWSLKLNFAISCDDILSVRGISKGCLVQFVLKEVLY